MDNLAHALVGACLGRAAAGHRVPRAAVLGAVAANAPDWAELFTGYPWPGAQYLLYHRGITHSIAGALVETAGLTLVVASFSAWWERRRGTTVTSPWWILACVALTVASHVFMDWQGSYGLRPFLPWSGRWYYGDFVAIVDPIFWLVPLLALAWGAKRHWLHALAVVAVAAPVAWLLARTAGVARWLDLACALLLAAVVIGWVRHWSGVAGRRRIAVQAIAVLAAYTVAQATVSIPVRGKVRAAAAAHFGREAHWAVLTVIGHPFTWDGVYANHDSVIGPGWQAARHLDLEVVRRAMVRSKDAQAIVTFARFLAAEVDSSERPVVVFLRDARYRPRPVRRSGFAGVAVPME